MNLLVNFFEIRQGDIADAPALYGADAIVNAANPTLMGSTKGVDGSIHAKVDSLAGKAGFLKNNIKEQMGKADDEDDRIRCQRGKVVVTSGYALCKAIFHTVGPESDADKMWPHVCSSSRMAILASCYQNIILEALKRTDIERIAVPVVGSGTYKIDFKQAFRTAVTVLYNTLLEQKQKDPEFFEYMKLKKIIFIIPEDKADQYLEAVKILDEYKKIFWKESRVVSQRSLESQCAFLKEICLYDEQRGYFSIARTFRMLLTAVRIIFLTTYLKDWIGGWDWVKRRKIVEYTVIGKMILFPFLGFEILKFTSGSWRILVIFLLFLALLDTITYLLALIVLADIQRPSANVIRSMIMLCINYIEVSLDISVIFYACYYGGIKFREAMAFGLLGNEAEDIAQTLTKTYYFMLYMNQGIKFFFLTLAFGYFANHLRQRKFRQ